eukprot:GHVR01007719.1.p1 GENE.GHVR01007719.1~~GHVR01007719.1.p1  ORF type:complete len:115 (+),score=26.67 GHVR01007719.1:32-376(+)
MFLRLCICLVIVVNVTGEVVRNVYENIESQLSDIRMNTIDGYNTFKVAVDSDKLHTCVFSNYYSDIIIKNIPYDEVSQNESGGGGGGGDDDGDYLNHPHKGYAIYIYIYIPLYQ